MAYELLDKFIEHLLNTPAPDKYDYELLSRVEEAIFRIYFPTGIITAKQVPDEVLVFVGSLLVRCITDSVPSVAMDEESLNIEDNVCKIAVVLYSPDGSEKANYFPFKRAQNFFLKPNEDGLTPYLDMCELFCRYTTKELLTVCRNIGDGWHVTPRRNIIRLQVLNKHTQKKIGKSQVLDPNGELKQTKILYPDTMEGIISEN